MAAAWSKAADTSWSLPDRTYQSANGNPEDYIIGADATIDDVDLETEAEAETETETVYVNGERLTEQRVEQMAAESVRLARAREATLIPDGKHSPVVQVRVSEATRDKLKAIAERRRMSVSKLSRQVLDDFVGSHYKQ